MQRRLPFQSTRPKLNRALAAISIALVVNTFGTCLLIAFGAWFAGVVTGVPAIPPGYVFKPPWA